MAEGNPRIAELGRDFWEHGRGAAWIRWGTKGATRRCHDLVMKHAGFGDQQAWGYCAERHHAVLGTWPGQKKGGKGRRDQLSPAQERGAVPLREDGSPAVADEYPGTLDLDDSWADLSDLPDLTGVTVADLEAAEAGAAGGHGDGG